MAARIEGIVQYRLNISQRPTTSLLPSNSEEDIDQSRQSYAESSNNPLAEAGFYLVASSPSTSSSYDCEEYLLSIPDHLIKQVCDAARFRYLVQVSDYRVIPLGTSSKTTFLEIHNQGLQVIDPRNPSPEIDPIHLDNFLSLQQIFAQEKQTAKEQLQTEPNNDQKRGKKRKRPQSLRFNLRATVDAISPIILVDKHDDPFALMELYDDSESDGDPCSCIVVLQGKDSLLCRDGIFPGDTITLKQVKRQRWKILDQVIQRKAFHLKRRIPTHVFLLKDAKDVGWQYPLRSKEPRLILPLPSTPIPLVSLQGRVVTREWARHASSSSSSTSTSESTRHSYILHSIEIQLLQGNEAGWDDSAKPKACAPRHVLFLTYFPMAPTLILSLRPGALVRAVNVHCIGRSLGDPAEGIFTYYYAACLRSTVSTIEVVPPSVTEKNLETLYEYYPTQPYAFRRIERSYLEYACRKVLHEWYERNFLEASSSSSSGPSLPNFHEIAKVWQGDTDISNWEPGGSRNPYMEFCDHACDEDEDDNKRDDEGPGGTSIGEGVTKPLQRDGCHATVLDSTQTRELPVWLSLSDMRQKCTSAFHGRLKEILRKEKPPVGWTASTVFADQELLQVLQSRTSNGADGEKSRDIPGMLPTKSPPIYTGGIVRGSAESHERVTSVSFSDHQCTLPATVLLPGGNKSINGSNSSEAFHATNSVSFAYGLLNRVVVSSICLGVAPGFESLPQEPKSSSDKPLKQNGNHQGRACANNPYSKKSLRRRDVNMVPIPLYEDGVKMDSNPTSLGSCSFVQAQGLLFMVSIQLRLADLVPLSSDSATKPKNAANESQVTDKASNAWGGKDPAPGPSYYTIQQCLDPGVAAPLEDAATKPSSNVIVGFLARQRFRVMNMRNSQYRGCVMTLAHLPIDQVHDETHGSEGHMSCVQSIEVKVTIDFKQATKMKDFLKERISKLLPKQTLVGDDPANMALAWWKAADNKDYCPLTAGGWDDFLSANHTSNRPDRNICIAVQIPATAALSGEARGYKRFSCSLDDMRARFCQIAGTEERSPSAQKEIQFDDLPDFSGGFKFLPGMLDRRPRRVIQKVDVATHQMPSASFLPTVNNAGELMMLAPTLQSGIPECRLSDLLRCICLDLQTQQRQPTRNRNLAPSLVRKTIGARFLGVSFCQARAMCTKCFVPLKYGKATTQLQQASKKEQAGRKKKAKDKERPYWQEDNNEQPSFWHCPLPIPGSAEAQTVKPPTHDKSVTNTTIHETEDANKGAAVQEAKKGTNLCCPRKGCCVQTYGEIKWECSGTLDDGTGQAKLYAERETATLLLGMCRSVLDKIEEGAWRHKDGTIAFSKTIPPPSHLAKAVEGANFKYTAQERFYQKHRHSKHETSIPKPEKRDVLSFLEPVDRAIYLMYQHCRHSPRVTRPLDYLVRCKPLADNVIHLNHTEIDMLSLGTTRHAGDGTPSVSNVATYSLPPLKLNLVDCCLAAPSSRDSVVDETWELIQTLQGDV